MTGSQRRYCRESRRVRQRKGKKGEKRYGSGSKRGIWTRRRESPLLRKGGGEKRLSGKRGKKTTFGHGRKRERVLSFAKDSVLNKRGKTRELSSERQKEKMLMLTSEDYFRFTKRK